MMQSSMPIDAASCADVAPESLYILLQAESRSKVKGEPEDGKDEGLVEGPASASMIASCSVIFLLLLDSQDRATKRFV